MLKMLIWKKILLAILAVVIIAVLGIYVFLSTNGHRLFNEQASSLTNRKVSVQSIAPKLPAGVVLKGLVVEGLITVQRVRVDVDPLALLQGRVRLLSAELEKPVLFLERGEDAAVKPLALGSGSASPNVTASSTAGKTKAKPPAVILHQLFISGGEIRLRDRKSAREWVVEDIKGTVRDIPLTGDPVRTEFFLSASLAKLDVPFVGHFAKAKGWANWAAKDMDASAQAVDDDGRVGLDVQLLSKSDDLQVKGHIKMSPGQQKQASGKKSGKVEDMILGVLGAVATDIDADFSFRTAMDHFEIGQVALKGKILSGLNSDKTSGTIIDEMRAVGEELLRKDKSGEAK